MNPNMNPGSQEAIKAGCTCPVLDNNHGKGFGATAPNGEPLFWFYSECPLHGHFKLTKTFNAVITIDEV